jgi:hypothetical protein
MSLIEFKIINRCEFKQNIFIVKSIKYFNARGLPRIARIILPRMHELFLPAVECLLPRMHELFLPAVGMHIAKDAGIIFACGGHAYCHEFNGEFC